ncbi:MAG: transcription elongation factor GreB [Gammaproteobacteria bacterium]|nr:transcription elongation factor GreB [Gammaproteobacteria bacterium]
MTRWRPPAPKSSPYITPEGYRALEAELRMLDERRRDTVRHLAAAAAEGDRSENAEYIYRKKELREIDRRLGYLQRRMPTLNIVSRPPPVSDQVSFGAWVTLEDEAGGEHCHRIVGADETALSAGFISVDAPLAQALLKRRVDEEITLATPEGTRRYLILEVRYVP